VSPTGRCNGGCPAQHLEATSRARICRGAETECRAGHEVNPNIKSPMTGITNNAATDASSPVHAASRAEVTVPVTNRRHHSPTPTGGETTHAGAKNDDASAEPDPIRAAVRRSP